VTNVEFSVFIEQWLFDVLLDDESTRRAIVALLPSFESDMHIIQRIAHADAVASIAVLSWFNNPHILLLAILLLKALETVVVGQEILVLGVVKAFDQVEGQRQGFE
jgi:hypothetical protein